jgi:CubicO group peptidase (beta-lactamase class C family)
VSTSERELEAALEEARRRYHAPGASLALVSDGATVARCGVGTANPAVPVNMTADTLVAIGSAGKLLTVALVMQLRDVGAFELTDRYVDHVPELAVKGDCESITILDLLTHRSGLPGDFFPNCGTGRDALARFVSQLDAVEPVLPPGTMFSGSNIGYTLLGHLIEKSTDLSCSAALKRGLYEPLRMEHSESELYRLLLHPVSLAYQPSTYESREDIQLPIFVPWMTSVGGTMFSSVGDVAALLAHLLDPGSSSAQVMSAASCGQLFESFGSVPSGDGAGYQISLGFGRINDHLWEVAGGVWGQSCHVRLRRDDRSALLLMSNSVFASQMLRDLIAGVPELARFDIEQPPEVAPLELRDMEIDAVVGDYEQQGMRVEVRKAAGDDPTLRVEIFGHTGFSQGVSKFRWGRGGLYWMCDAAAPTALQFFEHDGALMCHARGHALRRCSSTESRAGA